MAMRRAHLQEENDQLEEELRGKVSALKSISIHIGNEVRDQKKLISDMDNDMDKVSGFLGSTMSKLKNISKGGYGKMYFYLLLFAMAVFFVMYLIIRLS